jgi:hypothetical protein
MPGQKKRIKKEATLGNPVTSNLPAVPLEAILNTEELARRSSRAPDYQAENRAFTKLVQSLTDDPRSVLQTLAETVLETVKADSAGLSLLTEDGKNFRWAAIAGQWKPHLGGGTPRDFGPCGDVLNSDRTLLFRHWETGSRVGVAFAPIPAIASALSPDRTSEGDRYRRRPLVTTSAGRGPGRHRRVHHDTGRFRSAEDAAA